MSKLASKHFTTSGTWTCPAGVTKVYVLAQGGGSGGSGGANATFNSCLSGNGTVPHLISLGVVPNTTYTITIGSGGAGGSARTSSTQNGQIGGDTSFGALYTFNGALMPQAESSIYYGAFCGLVIPGSTGVKTSGLVSNTGTTGTQSGSYLAGRRGADGYYGSVAGSGGNSNSSGVGSNGTNATGYGAGGGAGGSGSTAGGVGGNGAPGQMWVIWVE